VALVVGVVLLLWSLQYANAGIRPGFDLPVAAVGVVLLVAGVVRGAVEYVVHSGDPTRPAGTWWYIVAGQCLFLAVFALATAGFGFDPTSAVLAVPNAALLLAYPFAMWGDAGYVRATSSTWQPDRWISLGAAVFVVATVGVGTFLVSPVYLYRRHRHLGTP
jgi:hypothetical protein